MKPDTLLEMRTDVNAVAHASLSKPPKVPGRKVKSEASKSYKHESERRRQGDDGRTGLRSSKGPKIQGESPLH